jgi:hypothetical protein
MFSEDGQKVGRTDVRTDVNESKSLFAVLQTRLKSDKTVSVKMIIQSQDRCVLLVLSNINFMETDNSYNYGKDTKTKFGACVLDVHVF